MTYNIEELIKNNPEGTDRLLRDVMNQKPTVEWERWTVPILFALYVFFLFLIVLGIFVPKQLDQLFSWVANQF